ncbi:hypothetical protein BV25DRAFT_1022790 [Artomyces pyxidatus]|uniref:Uncharacterized protein n=1 Tax=Artomyces pyxidatus TaxID=48021 RepID=A0ACB8ST46_9AGAM|nr:hypothetical protein BV25DRAFT_1022790 [Artomyces pyxidatus]
MYADSNLPQRGEAVMSRVCSNMRALIDQGLPGKYGVERTKFSWSKHLESLHWRAWSSRTRRRVAAARVQTLCRRSRPAMFGDNKQMRDRPASTLHRTTIFCVKVCHGDYVDPARRVDVAERRVKSPIWHRSLPINNFLSECLRRMNRTLQHEAISPGFASPTSAPLDENGNGFDDGRCIVEEST